MPRRGGVSFDDRDCRSSSIYWREGLRVKVPLLSINPFFLLAHLSSHLLHTVSMAGKKRASAVGKAPSVSTSVPRKKAGDWRCSSVPAKTFAFLQKEGQIPQDANCYRKPEKDEEVPHPRKDERVVFTDHFPRGFSFPLHPFFRALLYVYGIQLHDLPPNAIQHISCFIVLCECFLGIHPHWALWKRIFSVKIHTESPAEGEKYGLPCTTGAFGIQVTKNVAYSDMKFLASVQN